jgi:hypothetical protein
VPLLVFDFGRSSSQPLLEFSPTTNASATRQLRKKRMYFVDIQYISHYKFIFNFHAWVVADASVVGENSNNGWKFFSPYSVNAETSAIHYNSSPYTYVYNNPLLFRDLMGLDTTKSKILDEVQVIGWRNPVWLGPTLIGLGQPFDILKPIGAAGSKPGSSIASYTLSKALPYSSPLLKRTTRKVAAKIIGKQAAKKVGTAIVGRFLGRLVPYAGWALTAKDAWIYRKELGEFFQGSYQAMGVGMETHRELQKDPLTSGR